MNPEHSSQLRQQERSTQEQGLARQSSAAPALEFETVDELLRYDSARQPVPPGVGERLNAAIAADPPPARPWYRRLFTLSDG